MEMRGEKVEALHIEYSFRRVYDTGEDGELIRRYHVEQRGYCYTKFRHERTKEYMVKGPKGE